MIIIRDKTMHLVFSEDEGVYYWERLDNWKVSQTFKTIRAAIVARQNDELAWE